MVGFCLKTTCTYARWKIRDFGQAFEKVSLNLHERFRRSKSLGLVCTQFFVL